jgi:outer membrane receptor protein involved in Fe transport
MKKELVSLRLLMAPLLVVCAFSMALAGTTGKITGRVIDRGTKEGLPGVNVTVKGTTMGAPTNLKGDFVILNIPPGTYSLGASMMGYNPETRINVRVSADLTTEANFELSSKVIEIEREVVVTAEKPIIQKDRTQTLNVLGDDAIKNMPVLSVVDVVAKQAGAVVGANDQNLHVRGGRAGEVVFMVDGTLMIDPINNLIDSHAPLSSVQETQVYSGGFGAEYGSAQSGVINTVTKEGGPALSGMIAFRTSDFRLLVGKDKDRERNRIGDKSFYDSDHKEHLRRTDFGFGGPEPISTFLLPALGLRIPGQGLTYFLSGEIINSDGRYDYDDSRDRTIQGKLTYRPGVNYKITLGGLKNWNDFHNYDDINFNNNPHIEWKNLYSHCPDVREDGNQWSFTWNQSQFLNANTFYEVKADRYQTKRLENVFEDAYDNADLARGIFTERPDGIDDYKDENNDGREDNTGILWSDLEVPLRDKDDDGFFISGWHRSTWHSDDRQVYTLQGHLTSQVTKGHEAKAGFETKYFDLRTNDIDLASGGNIYEERYRVFPNSGAAYVRDKMEFQGMIVNAGLRLDYFNPNWHRYPADIYNPVPDSVLTTGGVILNPTTVPLKWQISPRLGVSHPITERDALHFTYGQYFQNPPMSFLYRNLNYDLSGAFPIVGNPNLKPERTTSYEVGIQHAFTNEASVDVTAFYKDITGLVDTERIDYTSVKYYTRYRNSDYGSTRGFEVSATKRPGGFLHYVSGSLNYTFSIARGKSSSTRQNYDYIWAGWKVPSKEFYLDWDQRHSLSVNVDFRLQGEQRLWGISWLRNFGLNALHTYGSGQRWTPPSTTKVQRVNERTLPSTSQTDIRLNKDFQVAGLELSLVVDALNVFNRRNLLRIAQDAESWYYAFGDPEGQYHDYTVWGERRLVRVGLELTK